MSDDATQVIEALDLMAKEGPQGTVAGAKAALRRALSAARAEGYAQAREQAAKEVESQTEHWCNPYTPCTCDWGSRLNDLPSTIRAMQDDSGDRRCGACGVPEVEGRYECRCTGMAAPPPAHRCGGCPHRIHAPNECLGDGGDCDCGWVP